MLILNFIFLQHQRSVNSVTLKQQQHLLDRRETAAFTLIYSLVLLQMDGLPSMAFPQCSHDPFQYKKSIYRQRPRAFKNIINGQFWAWTSRY